MVSIISRIANKELVAGMPKWLPDNMHYEVMMGSVAYGVSNDTSDIDLYGFCIPPKELIFPHLAGEIEGFGDRLPRFHQYDPHHIQDPERKTSYDLAIYNIVKYFDLCMGCNPNMIDSLFVPRRCVLSSTAVGEMVREQRKIFLHKGAWFTFKGYAYSQLDKIARASKTNSKRAESIQEHGYDVKFAYHIVRLLGEVEQIMIEHDLDITRNREQLKAIRRGEWTLEYLHEWFDAKERALEEVYTTSSLRPTPDEAAIRALLLNCLEHHYGSLQNAVRRDIEAGAIVDDLKQLIKKYGG